MGDLDSAILTAWARIRPILQSDPDELAARLARRRSQLLLRPPRAWCLAVRASDRRLPLHHPTTPQLHHASHNLTLTAPLLRELCRPIKIDPPGIKPTDLARQMGCRSSAISELRRRGHLEVVYNDSKWYGPRGRCLYTPRLLDPSNFNSRRPPDPLWGTLAPRIVQLIPDDFSHTLTRVRTFRSDGFGRSRLSASTQHPSAFNGYRWLCPACSKPVHIVYYPMRLMSLPEFFNEDLPQLREVDDPQPPLPTFACVRCHRVQYFSRCDGHNSWNRLIAWATAGLLYGHEVPRPQLLDGVPFLPERRRAYRPSKNRAPSVRQQEVLQRLLKRMTYHEIAADLGIARSTVHSLALAVYKRHNVKGREALAQKLNHELPKKKSAKREAVAAQLKEGKRYYHIAKALGMTNAAVRKHITAIRRAQRLLHPSSFSSSLTAMSSVESSPRAEG
jgi:DNA-binding CsgD family transcriptional regulator